MSERANFDRDVHGLLGLPFDRVDIEQATTLIRQAASTGKPIFLSTPNVNFAMACQHDEAFRRSLLASDLCVADGMPLVWVARLLGIPLRHRVSGADLFEHLRDQASERPLGVFFFGGPDGAAERACIRLNAAARNLRCVGFHAPGFGDIISMSGDAVIERINGSGADFLVVALGARKGQAWIEHNRARLSVPVLSHLGAVVNIAAGDIARAPAWMQKAGLEWAWRISQEPGLFRRYLGDGIALGKAFVSRVLPGVGLRVLQRLAYPKPAPGSFATSADGDLRIALRGHWRDASIDGFRGMLRGIAPERGVVVDLAGCLTIGSGTIGLLLLLEEQQRRGGGALIVKCARRFVRWSMRAHGACGLLAASGHTPVTSVQNNASMPSGIDARHLLPPLSATTPMASSRKALLLACLMLAISVGSVLARPDRKAAEAGPRIDLERLVPEEFGDWVAVDLPYAQVVNPQTREIVDRLYSQVLARTYVSSDGQRVMLSIAYGDEQRGDLQAHKPEVCYPAQGFQLLSMASATLATPYGSLPIRRLTTSLGARHEPVTYWFTFGDTVVGGAFVKRIVELRFGLTGQIPDGLLFRVSSIDRDAGAAFTIHERFVTSLLASIPEADRRRLSGLGSQTQGGT